MADTKPAARAADEGRKKARSSSPEAEDIGKVTVLDVLRVLGGLLLLNFALSWYITGESVLWGWRPWFSRVDGVRAWMVSLFSLLFFLFFEGGSSRGDYWCFEASLGVNKGPVFLCNVVFEGWIGGGWF